MRPTRTTRPDARTEALRPWRALLDACDQHHRNAAPGGVGAAHAGEPQGALRRAERVLAGLAAGADAPVPAWIAASERALDSEGNVRDLRPARALREMWCDRDAVLRLGMWGALRARAAAAPPLDTGAFEALMALISRHAQAVPPGLLPSRQHGAGPGGFADSREAALFFNGRLRRTLANLAALYDSRGADFARWQLLPDYVPGAPALEPWGQAWTVAVVATYVDWLHRSSGGSLAAALDLLWDDQPKRFRPPARVLRPAAGAGPETPKPAVLPTGDDGMHFELHLPIVLAQLLDHQPGRWDALRASAQRFAVALCMRTLDQADTKRRDAARDELRNITRYRGLTIVQVYMAVATAHLVDLLAPRRRPS